MTKGLEESNVCCVGLVETMKDVEDLRKWRDDFERRFIGLERKLDTRCDEIRKCIESGRREEVELRRGDVQNVRVYVKEQVDTLMTIIQGEGGVMAQISGVGKAISTIQRILLTAAIGLVGSGILGMILFLVQNAHKP